jgi:hypothetical protein
MDIKNIIETSFVELKRSNTSYLSISEISIVKEKNNPEFTRKVTSILFNCKYFRSHTSTAISFTELGFEAFRFNSIAEYEKSLKETDYFKIISLTATIIMVALGVLNYCTNQENKELRKQNTFQSKTIDSLELITDSLPKKTLK